MHEGVSEKHRRACDVIPLTLSSGFFLQEAQFAPSTMKTSTYQGFQMVSTTYCPSYCPYTLISVQKIPCGGIKYLSFLIYLTAHFILFYMKFTFHLKFRTTIQNTNTDMHILPPFVNFPQQWCLIDSYSCHPWMNRLQSGIVFARQAWEFSDCWSNCWAKAVRFMLTQRKEVCPSAAVCYW